MHREARTVGMLDFYEGMSVVTKIYAAIKNALKELESVHRPESGFASSNVESALIAASRMKFKWLKGL